MPDLLTRYLPTLNFILINIALAYSIYLTLSTGLLSLANAGFMAIGAYAAAISVTELGGSALGGMALGMAVAALVAWLFGRLVLRLRDVYLAIATLGFGEIVRLLALNGDRVLRALSGNPQLIVFNGAEGITLPYSTPAIVLGLPATTWPLVLYVLALTYLVVTLHRSPFGRRLAAIRLDEAAAATLGVPVLRYKLMAFVLGAVLAAGAGALSAPIVRVIDPGNYAFTRAVDVLAFAVLGGMTHPLGPLLGATLLTALPEALRALDEQREIVNGLIILLAILYLPRGLADPHFWRRIRTRLQPVPPGAPNERAAPEAHEAHGRG